jgi:hypothetical protein
MTLSNLHICCHATLTYHTSLIYQNLQNVNIMVKLYSKFPKWWILIEYSLLMVICVTTKEFKKYISLYSSINEALFTLKRYFGVPCNLIVLLQPSWIAIIWKVNFLQFQKNIFTDYSLQEPTKTDGPLWENSFPFLTSACVWFLIKSLSDTFKNELMCQLHRQNRNLCWNINVLPSFLISLNF